MTMSLPYALPLWAATTLLAAALLGIVEAGCRLGARGRATEDTDQWQVLSATLALLALLVGFTFALALNRYETRRLLVVEEANAIGTAYLRAGMAPEPFRTRLGAELQRYVDARLALAAAGEDATGIARAEALADSVQQALWSTTLAAVPAMQPPPMAALLVASVNTVIDDAGARRAALAARLPASVAAALMLYSLVVAGMLGYMVGGGRRSRVPSGVLMLMLTLALALIFDLDRPRTGTIRVSQAPLVDLRTSMTRR